MDNTSHINKFNTYLFLLGLCLSLIFVYFAQERVYNQMTFDIKELGTERFIRSFSVVFIFMTVVFNLFEAKTNYLPKLYIAYFTIVGLISVNYLFSTPEIDNLTHLMDSKGIGPWICLGLIFVSYDDYRYGLFKKLLNISIIVISVLVIYNLIEYGIGLYRGQALAKYRVYATNLVWISPYVFLILKNNKKLKYFRNFALLMGISTALLTQTRSFLLIYLLVLVFDFFHSKNKSYYLFGGLIMSLIFVYMILNIDSFSTSFELLQQRGMNDTRSNQLTQFLNQINFFDLIVGRGFGANWNFGGYTYYYLDNQWLYLIWWAGLIPAGLYFYLTAIIPFKLFVNSAQDYETRVEAFILILWTLACAGLAIYTSMSVEFYFFIICVIQGRLLYKYSTQSEYR